MRNCKLKNSPCKATTRQLVERMCNKYNIQGITEDTFLVEVKEKIVTSMQKAGVEEFWIRQEFLSDFELLIL